jgi:hypothetical protein
MKRYSRNVHLRALKGRLNPAQAEGLGVGVKTETTLGPVMIELVYGRDPHLCLDYTTRNPPADPMGTLL